MVRRKSQKDATQTNNNNNNNSNRRLRMSWIGNENKTSSQDESGSASDVLIDSEKRMEELGQTFGTDSILQIRMDPCERFLADDMLSPYDRYDQPPRTDLPNLEQHEAEQQALRDTLERQRQRRRRGARQAFRMVLRRGNNEDEDPSDHGQTPSGSQGLLGTTPSGSSGDDHPPQVDIYMTTPLHEAARLGAADFVRFLLANGGDPNVKNGQGRTCLHMSAGGWTKEEDRLTKAQSKSFSKNLKKKKNKSKVKNGLTAESSDMESAMDERPIGIRSTVIPEAMFELMHKESTSSADDDLSNKRKKRLMPVAGSWEGYLETTMAVVLALQ